MEIRKYKNVINESDSKMVGKLVEPVKLQQSAKDLIEQRIKDEYTAFYFYRNAANWCNEKNYKKAYVFFNAESENELSHAKKLEDFLVSWNIIPNIDKTETVYEFSSLYDVVNKAYEIEYNLYKKYNENSKEFISMGEFSVYDFIGEFRKIQMESVAEYSDMLNALNLINIENNFEVLYFEQTYM